MSDQRTGFSLVEMVVALVILSVVALGLGGATARLVTIAGNSAVELAAVNHVDDRIDRILADPAYDSLESRYAGTETGLEGVPSGTRETRFRHTREDLGSGRILDFRRVTVTVDAPMLRRPVARTVTVAAP